MYTHSIALVGMEPILSTIQLPNVIWPVTSHATPYFWRETQMKTLQARQVDLSRPRGSLGRFRLKFMRLSCGKSKVEQQVILQEHKFYINRHEYICLLWCIIRIFLSSITTDETVPSGPCGSAVVPEYAYLQTLIQVQSFICPKDFLPSVMNFTL